MRWVYVLGALVLVVLVVVGFAVFSAAKNNDAAHQKAQQLAQEFSNAGLTVPASENEIVRSLGDDGGAICDNPATALGKATLNDQITNGADFVGRRPVRLDPVVVQGEALVLKVYCPDKLAAFQHKIDGLKFDNTVKD
jgi:hypothetical protein